MSTITSIEEHYDSPATLTRRRYFDTDGNLLATTTRQPDGSYTTVDPDGNTVDPSSL